MTEHYLSRLPQFFLTPGGACPYLPGKVERKVFARLMGPHAAPLNDALTHSGFRRSQMIAYRPACDGCSACVSVRVVAGEFSASRSMRRMDRNNADILRTVVPPEATREQFARAYPNAARLFALKAKVDPDNRFRNRLWDKYGPA